MAPRTIPPPAFAAPPPDPDAPAYERWRPEHDLEREIDEVRPSAFPVARRFTTIYPFSQASDEATAAALRTARDHDRSSSTTLLDVLLGRKDEP